MIDTNGGMIDKGGRMTELDAALDALRSDAPRPCRVTVRLTAADMDTLRLLGVITGRTVTAAAETLLSISAARVRATMLDISGNTLDISEPMLDVSAAEV